MHTYTYLSFFLLLFLSLIFVSSPRGPIFGVDFFLLGPIYASSASLIATYISLGGSYFHLHISWCPFYKKLSIHHLSVWGVVVWASPQGCPPRYPPLGAHKGLTTNYHLLFENKETKNKK